MFFISTRILEPPPTLVSRPVNSLRAAARPCAGLLDVQADQELVRSVFAGADADALDGSREVERFLEVVGQLR